MKRSVYYLGWLLLAISTLQTPLPPAWASTYSLPSGFGRVDVEWGGHLKARGIVSQPEEGSVLQPEGGGRLYDGNIEGRLKGRLFLADWGDFEIHYEMVLAGGDTRKAGQALVERFPDLFKIGLFPGRIPDDKRRPLDLTKTLCESDDHILYQRLDRLALTLLPKWGVVRIGRQAITWGNGLLFNPMDLFNPFAPADIERDYKIGDDLAFIQLPMGSSGNLQFLYVPRRGRSDGDLEWNQSSLAGKLHFALDTTEIDVMAARHFEDIVVGLGGTGYLGGTAWRLDATWTHLNHGNGTSGYLSLVANMDYSWAWRGKNFYGFLEFFYNGLGKRNYTEALADPDIVERLDRGELFTLGRPYLSGLIQVELHPLFNLFLTVISNLSDPSGILQPRAVWDVAQDVQITFGANVFYGRKGSEFGGFRVPGPDLVSNPADSAFLWLSYYF